MLTDQLAVALAESIHCGILCYIDLTTQKLQPVTISPAGPDLQQDARVMLLSP